MAVAQRRDDRMGVAEYELWVAARPDGERWELLEHRLLSTSPQSGRHQLILANLLRRLDALAEPRGCHALSGLTIKAIGDTANALVPDVLAFDEPLPPDHIVDAPILVAEVMSLETMTRDRGQKCTVYGERSSVRTYLLAYDDEVRLEVWRKETGWTMQAFSREGIIDLPELGGVLRVTDVYARVTS